MVSKLSLEPISVDDAKSYVMKHLGESFVKGISINVAKGYGIVIAKTDDGEKEVKISIPRRLILSQ